MSKIEATEMAQQLTTLVAIAENSGLLPSTHMGQLTPVSGALTPSPGMHRYLHMCGSHIFRHTHIHINFKNSFRSKILLLHFYEVQQK